MSTGIALFAYNRPDHLQRVLSGLGNNDVEHLYIFADGPEHHEERPKVNAVKEVIENVECCETTVVTRPEHLGLAGSVIGGVDRVFQDHEQVIVLEDDCVPAPDFIQFMERSLDYYSDTVRVMNVSGYSPPISIPDRYSHDVFFTYRSSSWGWGTWRSAWDHFEYEPMPLEELERRESEIKRKTRKAGRDIYPMLRNQLRNEIDSWAAWWSYSIVANGGVCLVPVDSKIRNIGHDGSGTHSERSERYDAGLSASQGGGYSFPDEVVVDQRLNRRYNRFFGPSRVEQAKRTLKSFLEFFRPANP